jgi:diguanylate cyclase (GGDEF)-like protein
MKLKSFIVFILFCILFGVYYLYIQNLKQKDIQSVLNLQTQSLSIAKKAILDTYLTVNKKYYFDIINNKEIIKLLKEFKYASSEKQNIIRGKLYRKLYKEYELLKEVHNNQFHFHTFDGKSLLRFHVPYLNGDNLLDVRITVKKVIETKKPAIGFEGGRVYSGFRYVFPLIDKNDYLGSVEFSITYDAIEEKLNDVLKLEDTFFILKKSVSYDKVFKPYRVLFSVSAFDKNYYMENSSITKEAITTLSDEISQIIKDLKKDESFKEKLYKQKSFSMPVISQGNGYIVSFTNIKDISGVNAGYIVTIEKFNDLLHIEKKYSNFINLGVVVFFILYILVLIVLAQIEKIHEEAKKLQRFIDIQDSIVVLTDSKKFNFANKSFLEFFNYPSLEVFLKEHNCICEMFLNKENFFSLDDVKEHQEHWIKTLLELPGRKRIVAMKNSNKELHAFSVSINRYDEKNYIVSFSDISDTMTEKLQLEKEVVKDRLTHAYNRIYFDKNIENIISLHKNKNLKTGVIFFDIDFFKKINDTYGHDKGDEVLKDIVKIVKLHIRKDDKLIRWGGEEFIILVPVRNMQELFSVAQNLRKAIQDYKFSVPNTITCSFGLAILEDDIKETIKQADENLYKAKNSGRNRVVSD